MFTFTDVLNTWNEMGVFSYVIPFLLIFAVIFAILEKAKILGDNRVMMAIVATAVGLLALQYDFVPRFFAVIFPRFGIGLSIFLCLIIFVGFFWPKNDGKSHGSWIGYIVGIGVAVWALMSWDEWSGDFGGWFSDYIWAIIIIAVIVMVIVLAIRSKETPTTTGHTGGGGHG